MIYYVLFFIATIIAGVLCSATPDNANLFISAFVYIFAFGVGEVKYKVVGRKVITKRPKESRVVLILSLLFIIFFSSFSKVNTGHTGILVSFGKVENKTYSEGIVIKPFWKNMVQVDNRIQKNGHDDKPISLTAFTRDTQQVFLNYTVNYRINRENASQLYKNIGIDYFKTVLIPIIQESVKIECAKYTADSLLENRDKLAQDIEKDIKEKFSQNYIDLTATAIEDLGFTDEYEKAVEQKQVAMQEKLRAEQEAEKVKVEADANAYKIEKNAEAEAKANELKQKTITKELIEYEKIQKWDGKLPTVEGGGNAIIDMR